MLTGLTLSLAGVALLVGDVGIIDTVMVGGSAVYGSALA